MRDVRLHFSKTFDSRYSSHLDLMRCFSRALKRSGIPIWYTEGFNKHIYVTFAQPLPLGFESICETADIRIMNDEFDPTFIYTINEGFPYGIEIFNWNYPVMKPKDVAYARYMIELGDSGVASERICECAAGIIKSDAVLIEKRTKRGEMKTIDIKPMVHSCIISDREGKCFIDTVVSCSSENNLNPALLIDSVQKECNVGFEHLLIKRTQLLTKDMENFN